MVIDVIGESEIFFLPFLGNSTEFSGEIFGNVFRKNFRVFYHSVSTNLRPLLN